MKARAVHRIKDLFRSMGSSDNHLSDASLIGARKILPRRAVIFVALEFDHGSFRPRIKWIVVECAGVGRKCDAPIVLAPRRDRAYFISLSTACEDAKSYANSKNRQAKNELSSEEQSARIGVRAGLQPLRHYAYARDHLLIVDSPLAWAVLEWSGHDEEDDMRMDAAYFTKTDEAELDPRAFAFLQERRVQHFRPEALSHG